MTAVARPAIAVCAMGKDVYLDLAARWIEELRAAGRKVVDLRANVVDRRGLLNGLATGPELVIYAGHGRSRGWAGYQTVRWPHVAATDFARPLGVVLALACDTVAVDPSQLSFGEHLVASGRARAYVGAAGPLKIADGASLGDRLVP